MPHLNEPALYGLTSANSNRSGSDLWGKNQFNTTFPISLCILMRDESVKPVSILCQEDGNVKAQQEWAMDDLVGKNDARELLRYNFEKSFDGYKGLSRNVDDRIDLVVSLSGKHHMPLEVKFTVIPDSTTKEREENKWGPEIVIRPVSSAYAMMGVATALRANKNLKSQAINVLRHAYNRIEGWENQTEIYARKDYLINAFKETLSIARNLQKPFVIQPIWKTQGQSLTLSENCFDVFVWSDVAILSVSILLCQTDRGKVTRHLREIARHVRALYDVLNSDDFNYTGIYKSMGLGMQTDKAFAISGNISRKFLEHPRLNTPYYKRDILSRLILHGGERELKPERRFDAAVVTHFNRD